MGHLDQTQGTPQNPPIAWPVTLEARRAWWRGRAVAVWGAARTGIAAARLLVRLGAQVTLSDPRPAEALAGLDELKALKGFKGLGGSLELRLGEPNTLGDAEVLIPSPGLRPHHPLIKGALKRGVHLISEVELGAQVTAAELVAITGTDGKSTTTLLVTEALRAHDLWARGVGNIGDPISNWALEAPSGGYLVLEVSAFQLWSTSALGCTRVGVITNIAEDHHDHFEGGALPAAQAYRAAKLKLATLLAPEGSLLYPPSALTLTEDLRALTPYHAPHTPLETPLLGAHNQLNLSAALATLNALGLDPTPALRSFKTFTPLPYRLTLTRVLDGARYINDSKATNVHAACVGLRSLPSPERLIVIAGGYDKGLELTPLIELLGTHAQLVLTIGQTGPQLERALRARSANAPEVVACVKLERAVEVAAQRARSGDLIILSPAASSFDQFESYEARGARFDALVNALPSALLSDKLETE